MKNLDLGTTELRLRRMRESLDRVRAVRARGPEALAASPELESHLRRELQVALQSCIDTGAEILTASNGEVPESFAATFERLGEMGVLPADLARGLVAVAELRNHLVFGYLEDEDPRLLLERLGLLDDIEAFGRFVADQIDPGPGK